MKCAWLNRSYETGPFSGHLFRAVQFYSDTNSWPVPNSFLLCHPWMQFAERVLFYLLFKFFKKFTFIFQLHYAACGILAHQRGIKPMPPALEAWSLNHRTIREVPYTAFLQVFGTDENTRLVEITLPGGRHVGGGEYAMNSLSS